MNSAGSASEGKLTEKKSVAESFLGGHGSPYVAQISMANTATLYKSVLDGLCYRGTAFFQVFTTCQPEHGVPDYAASLQAQRIRDSRGMPEFIFNPQLGETYSEAISIKGNPHSNKDWYSKKAPVSKTAYDYTVAHWAFTEARFRLHHKVVPEEKIDGLVRLEDKIKLIVMNDIIHRHYLDKSHRSYIPEWGTYTIDYADDGKPVYHFSAVGCFADYAVVPQECCVKLDKDIPLEVAALIGCAVTTGVGVFVGPGVGVLVGGAV